MGTRLGRLLFGQIKRSFTATKFFFLATRNVVYKVVYSATGPVFVHFRRGEAFMYAFLYQNSVFIYAGVTYVSAVDLSELFNALWSSNTGRNFLRLTYVILNTITGVKIIMNGDTGGRTPPDQFTHAGLEIVCKIGVNINERIALEKKKSNYAKNLALQEARGLRMPEYKKFSNPLIRGSNHYNPTPFIETAESKAQELESAYQERIQLLTSLKNQYIFRTWKDFDAHSESLRSNSIPLGIVVQRVDVNNPEIKNLASRGEIEGKTIDITTVCKVE